jgi:hypothetical protein
MKTVLLLALLAPGQDYAPADPPLKPVTGILPEGDETTSLCYRTFRQDTVLRFGADPRFYHRLTQTEYARISAGLGYDGAGLACEYYLGNRFAFWAEARTCLFRGTARVGLIYYPMQGARFPLSIDLVNGRVILPQREEVLESAVTVGAIYVAFGGLKPLEDLWDRITGKSAPCRSTDAGHRE